MIKKSLTFCYRRDSIVDYYAQSTYLMYKFKGLLTYIEKIQDHQQNVIGILVSDVPLTYIFNSYTNWSEFTEVLDLFIKTPSGAEFSSPDNTLGIDKYKNGNYVYCSQQISDDGSYIEVFIPLFPPNNQLLQEMAKTVPVTLMILFICYFWVMVLERSIVVPIKELRELVKQNIPPVSE